LSAIFPPSKVVTSYGNKVLRFLPVIVSEVEIVRNSTHAFVASHAIHKVDAILRVSHDAFLGVASHHKCLVEVR